MTEVQTSYGRLRGTVEDGLSVFRGIPFAQADRFKAPEPTTPWDGVRDATRFGAACPQGAGQAAAAANRNAGVFGGLFGPGELELSEDCLFLNVWTPACDGQQRPVLVWIHGGAFTMGTGASAMYAGAQLAASGDVVVVTINYRLGPFGFTYLPGVATPNCGLLDQVAALRWVRDEIASFGGDPQNVTIFGESAGGKSVECLVALPSARGLFKRAVMQSTYDAPLDPATSEARSNALVEEIGGVDALVAASADEILAASARVQMKQMQATGGLAAGGAGTAPVVDGDVLPKAPLQAFADGDVTGIPVVVGTTLDESRLFGAMMPNMQQMDDATLVQRLATLVPREAERAAELYAKTLADRRDNVGPSDIWMACSTDKMFRQHSIRVAEAMSQHQPSTFMYLFTWDATAFDGRLGACHGLEIPFVFGTLDGGMGQLAGDGPEARALSAQMQDAWLSFAKTGAPGWPSYDAAQRRTMTYGRSSGVEDAPLEDERVFWASLA